MSRRYSGDLHKEPRKWATALLALAVIALPAVLLSLSVSADSSSPRLAVYRPSLVPIPPVAGGSPPPLVAVEKSAPPAESSPLPPRSPSAAELALKRVNVSLAAERKKREEEALAREEEEKKRKEEEERKKREEEERKKREQEEEERRRLEEERELEEERQREAERLAEAEAEARRREQEAAQARAQAAADAAAREAAEAARAAEVARLASLLDIYKARIIAQIERDLDTPAAVRGQKDVVVEVRVLLHSDGELNGWPRVTRSSGFPEYDEEAIRAVIRAAPLVVPSDEPELMRQFMRLDLRISPEE